MPATKKARKPVEVTPAPGEFGYSHLVTPGKFGDFDVEYILEGEEAEALKAKLDEVSDEGWRQALADAKTPAAKKVIEDKWDRITGYKPEVNKDTGEETGRTVFKFKNKAKGENRNTGESWETKIIIVDAKKKPLPNPKIGKGTIGKVAYTSSPFFMPSSKMAGISLRLKGVQILELKEWGGGAADAFGEEEGYQAEEPAGVAEGSASSDF